jgi:plastocyanin
MRFATVLAALVAAAPLSAQSLLYRSPNLSGTWVAEPGMMQFNFLHRFYVAPTSAGHAVVNYPTFTLATGVARRVAVGAWFATKSPAGIGRNSVSSNETEVFARWRAVGGVDGSAGLHVALTPAYDFLAKSVDGELGLEYTVGALTLQGAARIMSKPLGSSNGARAAFGGGAIARLTRFVAVSADVGSFVSPTVLAAWSAGIQILIPDSPHSFSFQVSNTNASTIQGNSIGFRQRLYGFEFTIPLHFKRFGQLFRRAASPSVTGDVDAAVAAVVTIGAMKFPADTTVIAAGQAVRWNNADPLGHTVTFDAASGESSSALVPPNGSYVHRFTKPGTYSYQCTPHPFMKGVVMVK